MYQNDVRSFELSFVHSSMCVVQLYCNGLVCFTLAVSDAFYDSVNFRNEVKWFHFEFAAIDLRNEHFSPSYY